MVIRKSGSATWRARLTSQGQITVPKPVREALDASPGDELEFTKASAGFVVRLRPRVSVLDLAGSAAKSAAELPRTAEDLDELLRNLATERAVAREARLRSDQRSRR